MGNVPTIEELGIADLLPKEAQDDATTSAKVWGISPQDVKLGPEAVKMREEYKTLNGMLFLIFVVPAVFAALLFGIPETEFFYYWIKVWVHEAGHGFWGLFGNDTFGAAMGFGNELLFTLVPALICLRFKQARFAACVLFMCVGMSMQHNGIYMQSALDPHGTSFAGALTHNYNDMNENNHDWAIVFRNLGLLPYSVIIGEFVYDLGTAVTITCMFASILGFFPMLYDAVPKNFATVIAPGAAAAVAIFIITWAPLTQTVLALIFAKPLLIVLFYKWRRRAAT